MKRAVTATRPIEPTELGFDPEVATRREAVPVLDAVAPALPATRAPTKRVVAESVLLVCLVFVSLMTGFLIGRAS